MENDRFRPADVIAGGEGNFIATANNASIVGGYRNTITNAAFAVVPGGSENVAAGSWAFAAGHRAQALHQGAFVWADSTSADLASDTSDQFTVRASGGVRIFSDSGATVGVFLPPGGNSWAPTSDRNAKENFKPADGKEVLCRVASLPIQTYNMKTQDPSIRHIGPTAQDFHAAFGVGEDDRHITTVDADGVALAAIQGLNEVVKEKEAKVADLEKRVADLERLVAALVSKAAGNPTQN